MTYYAIKLNETEYYDGDPRRWEIPSSDNPNSAVLFAQFVWAEAVSKSLQDRWPGAHVVPASGVVEVKTEPVKDDETEVLLKSHEEAVRAIPSEYARTILSASIKMMAAEIETLKRRNAEGAEQVSALKAENAKLSAQVDRLKAKIDALGEENTKLKADAAAIHAEIPVHYAAMITPAIGVRAMVHEIQRLTHQLTVYQDEANRAWAELPGTTEDYLPDAIKALYETLKSRAVERGKQVDALTEENATLKAKLAQWKTAASATFGYEETPISLEAKMGRVSKELFTLRGEIDVKSSEIRRLEYKLKEMAKSEPAADEEIQGVIAELTCRAQVSGMQHIEPHVLRGWRDVLQRAAAMVPVADAEIRRVLDEIDCGIQYCNPQALRHWRNTLQAVGADLVVARESLEQCKMALPEEMRGVSLVQGIRALRDGESACREVLQKSNDHWAKASRERDEARELLQEHRTALQEVREDRDSAWAALPEEWRRLGGKLSSRVRDLALSRESAIALADRLQDKVTSLALILRRSGSDGIATEEEPIE